MEPAGTVSPDGTAHSDVGSLADVGATADGGATPRLRILFVSGTSVGGAARSTHELAAVLAARGHEVAVLSAVDEALRTRRIHKRLLDGAVRIGGPVGRTIHAVRRRVGRRAIPDPRPTYPAWRAPLPENALASRIELVRPDIVVVSSVERPAWRQIHAHLAAAGLSSILYLRERTAIGHLAGWQAYTASDSQASSAHGAQSRIAPDLVVANSEGHAREARLAGYPTVVVPSIVDVANCRTETTRTRVVFVNPVPLFGLDIALALAAARPDIPFTFARSWPLSSAEERDLLDATAPLANVVVADPVAEPHRVYEHARVVLVPYRHPGRPRVVAEAQASGIPVLGSDSDGTAEAIGPGGIVVALDAPIDDWVRALSELWDDSERAAALSSLAREWAERAEMQPESIAATFEDCMRLAMEHGASDRSGGYEPAS